MLVLVCLCASMAACSKVSQSYADKVNDAAKNDKAYTYEKVIKDLGKEAMDYTAEIPVGGRNGVVVAVKGVKSKEDLKAKIDKGEKVDGITIVILDGKATEARFGTIDTSKLK